MHHSHGFSLLEILVVLAIVSILTRLCLPLYSQHLVTERRLEAIITLEKLAAALENYYTVHNTYQGTNLEKLGFSSLIAKNNYQLTITTLSDNMFSLAATPLTHQAQQDNSCGTLALDATGKKSITGNGQISDCWGYG